MLFLLFVFINFIIVDQSPWSLISSLQAMLLLDGSALYMHGYQNGFLVASTPFFYFRSSFSDSVSNGRRFFSNVKFNSMPIDKIPYLIKNDANIGNLNFINNKNLDVVLEDYLKKSVTPRWYSTSKEVVFKQEFFYQDLLSVYKTIGSFFLKNKGNSYILNINFYLDANDSNAIKLYDLDSPVFNINRSLIFYLIKYLLNIQFSGLIKENHLLEITRPYPVRVKDHFGDKLFIGFNYMFFFSIIEEQEMSKEQLENCDLKFPFLLSNSGLSIEQLENSVKSFMCNFNKKVLAYYHFIFSKKIFSEFKSQAPDNLFKGAVALPYNSSSNIIFEMGLFWLGISFSSFISVDEKKEALNFENSVSSFLENKYEDKSQRDLLLESMVLSFLEINYDLQHDENSFSSPAYLSQVLPNISSELSLSLSDSCMFKIYNENINLTEMLNTGSSNGLIPINLKSFLESHNGGVALSGTFSLLSYKDMSSIIDMSNFFKKIKENDVSSDGITVGYDVTSDSLQDLLKKFK